MNVKPAKVVRAQRFEVVDDEGRVRARIGPRTGAPWRSKGQRLVAFELFDLDGRPVASLTADDNGHTVELLVGAGYDGSQVRIRRLGDRGLWPARAEISAWAGHHSRWSAAAVAGAFPETHELVAVDEAPTKMRRRLREIQRDDLDMLVEFHIQGKVRFWGARRGNVCHLLWWDPEHGVWPSKRQRKPTGN